MPNRLRGRVPEKEGAGQDQSFAIALMQHLVVPTFVLDAEGKVLIWNRACERLTGVPASEVIGTQDHGFAFYDEPRPCLADLIAEGRTEEIDGFYSTYDTDASSSTLGFHVENWCRMPRAGTRLYLAVDAGPIYDEAGHLVAVVETLRDMTVQKEAQIQLEQLAAKDALTGLANRRAFDERLDAEWRRCQRGGQLLSIIMVDVDHFKTYNDTYGHPQGDVCLRSVASVLAGVAARTGDLVARYGGEEFVVVLPGTNSAGARVVAERIRVAIAALDMPHAASSVGAHVSVSLGVASADPSKLAAASLLMAADQALYAAKKLGRNRVEVAGEVP
ncbi:MAG: diguanylate cyclase [Proteobacteria bacterium]|nr:MAG: diguanylate cyclase [Pseudomonadota bacterium]